MQSDQQKNKTINLNTKGAKTGKKQTSKTTTRQEKKTWKEKNI